MVTLEPDVADKVKELAHQRRTSFNAALNELIRRGLTYPDRPDVPPTGTGSIEVMQITQQFLQDTSTVNSDHDLQGRREAA